MPAAVFLSYASQDAEAAKRIAEALRAAGVEVWFDQNELVGGDAWDAKIRKQIAECALFVLVISANTQARLEGYFRLEWKIAAQRTHTMADERVFLLPVVIDATRDPEALVPAEFKSVQWTRLPAGETSKAFCARVKMLLEGSAGLSPTRATTELGQQDRAAPAVRRRVPAAAGLAALAAALVLGGYFVLRPARDVGGVSSAPAATLPEAQRMERQARALIDDESLQVRETFRTAYELAEKAATLSPGDADIWATMARANAVLIDLYNERDERRVAAARSQAERAASLSPQSIEAGLALATVELLVLHTAPAEVRGRLEALHQRAPRDPRVLMLLAQTEDTDTVSPTAFRWLEQAEALPGGKARAALIQAWFFWGANRLRDSLAAVERSLAAQPLTEAYHLKLMLLLTVDDRPGALAWLKKIPAAVLREDRAAALAYETFLFARQPAEGLAVLRNIPRDVLEEGRYFEVRSLLEGEALLMAGRKNAAELALRAALKIIDDRLATNPSHSRLWHAKGRAQIRLGDRDGAARSFATAGELGGLRPLDAAAQFVLLGQRDEALAVIDQGMNRALTRWPSWLHYFKRHPVFDPLRDDAHFRELIARGDVWLAEELRPPAAIPVAKPTPPADESASSDKSVAVLAFANLSDDKANEYFSDGISEELLNVLAKVPGLKVTARTSAFHFKGKDTPIPEIAKQLGVAYVVEGSVRKAGDKVRITAQLIKAADGFHVWSDTFTRDLKDIFAVQDEIAGLIAKSLKLKLGAGDLAREKSTDLAAWQSYLDGRRAWNLRTMEGYREAETLLERAIALDARFARAYAALADVWQLRAIDGNVGVFSRQWRTFPAAIKARALIDKALELDPLCAEAYASLGMNLQLGWQDEPALQAYRKAIELNPNYATAHQWLGLAQLGVGRMDETLLELKLAAELDPLSHRILSDYAKALNLAGNPEEALIMSRRALGLQPGAVQAVLQEARALAMLGQPREAVALVEGTSKKDIPDRMLPDTLAILAIAKQLDVIRRLTADVEAMPTSTAKFAGLVALGRIDEALGNVESSILEDGWSLVEAAYGQLFEPIRHDARFQQIIEASGRAEYFRRAQAWRADHPPKKPETKK